MESQGGSGFRGALARLRHAPLWVWLTVLLTFGLLVFAYLQYRKSQASSAGTSSASLGTVPSDGSGQPNWSSAAGAADPGAELAAILAYIQSLQTPNPSPTATPTPPLTPGPISPEPLAPLNPPPPPPPTGPQPIPFLPKKTQVSSQTFAAGTTVNDVLKANPGLSLAWLQSWNRQANQQWFSHPWWQFPTSTKLNIPHAA